MLAARRFFSSVTPSLERAFQFASESRASMSYAAQQAEMAGDVEAATAFRAIASGDEAHSLALASFLAGEEDCKDIHLSQETAKNVTQLAEFKDGSARWFRSAAGAAFDKDDTEVGDMFESMADALERQANVIRSITLH